MTVISGLGKPPQKWDREVKPCGFASWAKVGKAPATVVIYIYRYRYIYIYNISRIKANEGWKFTQVQRADGDWQLGLYTSCGYQPIRLSSISMDFFKGKP